jgi:hypothetical protein
VDRRFLLLLSLSGDCEGKKTVLPKFLSDPFWRTEGFDLSRAQLSSLI